jgi:hypothetical protein
MDTRLPPANLVNLVRGTQAANRLLHKDPTAHLGPNWLHTWPAKFVACLAHETLAKPFGVTFRKNLLIGEDR